MTHSSAPRVVIVDGFGTGRALLRELLDCNVECLHMRSDDEPITTPFDLDAYDGDLGFSGDVGDAIQLLGELEPSAVVAGSPRATAYAEAVADGLGLPTHAIERFGARRHAQSLLLAARPDIGPVQSASLVRAPQFIVNTVSDAGAHRVTDAWRLLDIQDSVVPGPGALELIDPTFEPAARLFDQTRVALDNLGVLHGAAHAQLAVADNGLRLVGATACLMRLEPPNSVWPDAGLQAQAKVWAERLAATARSRRAPVGPATYDPSRPVTVVMFRFPRPSRVTGLDGLARLRTLPSFRGHVGPLSRGDIVEPRSTWLASGGLVAFVHDDPEQICADIRQFRAWESRSELYGLAPLTTAHDAR